MKTKEKLILAIFGILIGLFFGYVTTGCTENSRVKMFGGTGEMTLPRGQKLVLVTWKDSELWYLTKPMSKADSAETYHFQEKSSFGIMEGTYIIHETK